MLKQSHAISEELIEWRRDFHMHPKLDLNSTALQKLSGTSWKKWVIESGAG